MDGAGRWTSIESGVWLLGVMVGPWLFSLGVADFGVKLYFRGGRQVNGRVFFSHIRVSTWTTWKSK